jgi:hypothetical protein
MKLSAFARALEAAIDKNLGINAEQAAAALGELLADMHAKLAIWPCAMVMYDFYRRTETAHKEEGSLLDTALGKSTSEKLKGSTEKLAQQVSKVAPLVSKKVAQPPKSVPAPDDFFDSFLSLEPKSKTQGQSLTEVCDFLVTGAHADTKR